jgi:hypothetical protein
LILILVEGNPKRQWGSRKSQMPVSPGGLRLRGNDLENTRYVNSLHWVFDLPHSPEFAFEENAGPRIMMFYERATDQMEFEILDKGLPDEVREKISSWLRKSNHVWDVINGLV